MRSISYEEARDHAIAFGGIDGLKHARDDRFYAIRFTPRSERSNRKLVGMRLRDVVDGLKRQVLTIPADTAA